MTSTSLAAFIAQATARSRDRSEPADCVLALRPRAVSLHLYGRMMSHFNTYDVAARTRRQVALAHNES